MNDKPTVSEPFRMLFQQQSRQPMRWLGAANGTKKIGFRRFAVWDKFSQPTAAATAIGGRSCREEF